MELFRRSSGLVQNPEADATDLAKRAVERIPDEMLATDLSAGVKKRYVAWWAKSQDTYRIKAARDRSGSEPGIAYCGAKKVGDLDAADAASWLADMASVRGLSARSLNRHRAALMQFGRWCARTRRVGSNPFVVLKARNEAADRRRVRRALTPEG